MTIREEEKEEKRWRLETKRRGYSEGNPRESPLSEEDSYNCGISPGLSLPSSNNQVLPSPPAQCFYWQWLSLARIASESLQRLKFDSHSFTSNSPLASHSSEYDILFDQSPGCLTMISLSLPALEQQCQATLNYLQLPEWSWLVYISEPLSMRLPLLRTSSSLSPTITYPLFEKSVLLLQQALLCLPFLSHVLISILFMLLHNLFSHHHHPVLAVGLSNCVFLALGMV